MRTILYVLLLTACGSSKRDNDPGTDFAAKLGNEDLPLVKKAIADGKPGDSIYKCAADMTFVDKLEQVERYQALAKDIQDTCQHDLPLLRMKLATELAETVRKANPDKLAASECFSAEYKLALTDLQKAKREDDASKALAVRFHAVCPMIK